MRFLGSSFYYIGITKNVFNSNYFSNAKCQLTLESKRIAENKFDQSWKVFADFIKFYVISHFWPMTTCQQRLLSDSVTTNYQGPWKSVRYSHDFVITVKIFFENIPFGTNIWDFKAIMNIKKKAQNNTFFKLHH